jgi:hypothetical protein
MKKTAIAILVFSILYLVLGTSIHAQDFDAPKAYADYQYQLSVYQKAYSEFQEAKSFYQGNPTLQLKSEARRKTLKMLKERDNLIVVYLTAIRMHIWESKGFDENQKNAIYAKIDPEIEWYQNHIKNYLDSDEPVDLFNKSDESKSRLETNTTPIINEGLFDISLSQEIGIRLAHQQIFTDLKKYIDDQVAVGKLKIDPFNRWINDTDAVLQQLQKNEDSAVVKIQTLYSQNFGVGATYRNSVEILSSSISPLSQLNSYLTEMLISIQNQMK